MYGPLKVGIKNTANKGYVYFVIIFEDWVSSPLQD